MLDQTKSILIDSDIQEKLNALQNYFRKTEGIEYSEAALFRRAIHELYRNYVGSTDAVQ